MNSRKKTQWVLGGILLAALIAAGVVWGPSGYYALRYQQYESVYLSPELGRLTFIEYRVETRTAVIFRNEAGNTFSGTAGQPPLLFSFEEGGQLHTYIFPGVKLARKNGGTVSLVTDGPPPLEQLLKVIDERKRSHPDAGWERLIEQVHAAEEAKER